MNRSQCSCSLVIFASFLLATSSGDFPTGAIQGIRCTLLKNAPNNCDSVAEVKVPSYLVQAYNDAPKPLQEALRNGQLSKLSNEQLESLPTSILYLIPRERMMNLNGSQLASILKAHADDTSLAIQVASSLRQDDLLPFIQKLKIEDMSQDVLDIIGGTIDSSSLDKNFFKALQGQQESIITHLRPSVMLNKSTFYLVGLYIKTIETPATIKKETKYIIAQGAIRADFNLNTFSWLASGITPDYILNDASHIAVQSFKENLTQLQARAVFDRVYKNGMSEAIDSLAQMTKLSPRQLQQYPDNARSYDTLIHLPISSSLPSACQIKVFVMEDCERTGKLPTKGEPWGPRVRYIRQWVYTLPLTTLTDYLHEPLITSHLLQVTSSALSPMQAYYLTGKGDVLNVLKPNSIQGLGPMLQALPASQLVTRKVGDISSPVMGYLAAHLSANNWPRTLALVHKIASSIDEMFILENLLENKDVDAIMRMITPKDLQAGAAEMLDLMHKNNLLTKAHRLPQQVLAVLLETAQVSEDWSWQNMLDRSHPSHYLVGGLTCQHMEQMDTGLFIPIMAIYNHQRKQAFPKSLQYCGLQKLISHLKLKMTLTQTEPHHGLISMLEPVEIESVGGYILVGLPLEAMQASPYLGLILESIGRLSTTELMLAANTTRLQEIASLAVDENNTIDAYAAGNLIWWSPPSVTVSELKLVLEAGVVDTSICLPANIRGHLAVKLLREFGAPETWSASVLATLQDLLVVFAEDELNKVRRQSWRDSADSFSSFYGQEVPWSPQPDRFYQVCAEILGKSEEKDYKMAVARMVRKQMIAAQLLLDTVAEQVNQINPFNFDLNEIDQDNGETEDNTDDDLNDEDYPMSTTTELVTSTTEHTHHTEPVKIDVDHDNGGTTTTERISTTTVKSENRKISDDDKKTDINIDRRDDIKMDENEIKIDPVQTYNEPTTNRPSRTTKPIPTTTQTAIKHSEMTTTSFSNGVEDEKETTTEQENKWNSRNKTSIETPTIKFYSEPDVEENSNVIKEKEDSSVNPSKSVNEENNTLDNEVNFIDTNTFSDKIEIPKEKPTSESEEEVDNDSNDDQRTEISEESDDLRGKSNKGNVTVKLLPTDTNTQTNISNIPITDPPTDTDDESIIEQEESDYTEPEETTKTTTDSKLYPPPTTMKQKPYSSFTERNSGENNTNNNNDRNKRDVQEETTTLTCNALRMVGRLAELTLTEQDLNDISADELEECRVELGAMELNSTLLRIIWKRISNKGIGIHLLGNLLSAVSVADLWDLEFDVNEPWVLENIHAFIVALTRTNNTFVLGKLMTGVNDRNPELKAELMAVLGSSVCSLEEDQLQGLSVLELEPWSSCPEPSCLARLAQLAIKQLNRPPMWSHHHVRTLHAIVAGLDVQEWFALASTPSALAGLHPTAVPCLKPSHLEVLSPEQIQLIPTVSLLSLSEDQLAVLNASQTAVISNITQLTIPEVLTPSEPLDSPSLGVSHHTSAQYIVIFISLFHVFSYYLC